MKENYSEVKNEVLYSIFRDLASLGYGSIVLGRNQRPNRFVWDTRLTQVGKVAIGRLDGVEEYKPRQQLKAIIPSKAAPREYMSNVLKNPTYKVTIRKGDIEIDVPSDVTQETMEVISHLVEKL